MKYKKLTKEQIIISLDRLTRFKNTKEKYLRVFSDILTSCLIEPKLKKFDIENLDYTLITNYVVEIFNNSLEKTNQNCFINKFLRNYENNIFYNDKETQKLLDNSINYLGAISLIPDKCPVNLLWLKHLAIILNPSDAPLNTDSSQDLTKTLKQVRNDIKLKFPLEEVILVEGITEEILLPAFSKFLGYDFYANGVQIIAAGGKNQVVKKYYELSEQLKIPIFVLLDKDAENNIKQIQPKLRKQDRIHLVSCGEFEDLLPKSLIIKTVNSHFKNFLTITERDLLTEIPTAKLLEDIYKTKGLHEFKKAEFAKLVKENISDYSDVSEEIKAILEEITVTNKILDSEFCS